MNTNWEVEALQKNMQLMDEQNQHNETRKAVQTTHNLWLTEKDRYQKLYEQYLALQQTLNDIFYSADASADGHDEINEDTPEAYIKLLEGRLDAIHAMCKEVLK